MAPEKLKSRMAGNTDYMRSKMIELKNTVQTLDLVDIKSTIIELIRLVLIERRGKRKEKNLGTDKIDQAFQS